MVISKEKKNGRELDFTVCWVIALLSEAKPIISALKLTRTDNEAAFPIYKNDVLGHLMIIRGIGEKCIKEKCFNVKSSSSSKMLQAEKCFNWRSVSI